MFQNGLDKKDAIFLIVLLQGFDCGYRYVVILIEWHSSKLILLQVEGSSKDLQKTLVQVFSFHASQLLSLFDLAPKQIVSYHCNLLTLE